MKHYSVTMVSPNPSDPTSFYRGVGPFGQMKLDRGAEITLVYSKEYNWTTCAMSHIFFVQRPYRPQHYEIIEVAKLYGKKIWVDYDDDLFSVGTHNPAFKIYGPTSTKQTILKCLLAADVVTVSTEHLKQRVTEMMKKATDTHPRVVVIQNAVNTHLIPWTKKFQLGGNPVVLWRGSATHQMDLMSVGSEMQRVHMDPALKKWVWNFVGDLPWYITNYMEDRRCVASEGVDIGEFMDHIRRISPKVMIVPLVDEIFNKSKSNIAWIEGTLAGAIVVAPDMDEWKHQNILNYRTPEEFQEQLTRAMKMTDAEREAMVRGGFDEIQEKFTVQKQNEKRWAVLEDLCADHHGEAP